MQDGCIHLVKRRQFDVIETLMNSDWLSPLRHLIVLVCWDFCESPNDAQKLVSCAVSNYAELKNTSAMYIYLHSTG